MNSDTLHDLLAPDEPALFTGQPRGYRRPSGSDLFGYAALVGLAVFLIALGWWSVRGYATTNWSLSWGSLRFTGTSGQGTSAFGMPSPFAWVFLIAALELYRQASAWSLRLVITPRRVLTSAGVFRTRRTEFRRTGDEQVSAVTGGLRLRSHDGALDLFVHGLDAADAEGIRAALEAHDAGPTPPLPAPVITGRRVLALALVLVACLATVGWYRGTQAPETLEVSWRAGQLAVEVEGPYWVDGRLHLAELQLLDETGAVIKTNGASMGSGTGLVRTYQDHHLRVPPTVRRLRVRLAARRALPDDPRAVPGSAPPASGVFEVELEPGGVQHLTLRPDAAGWLQPEPR